MSRKPPPPPAADASRAREEALDWFVRRRDEEGLGAEEEGAFQSWLAADAAHRQAFDHWQGEWQAVGAIPPEMRSLLERNLAYDQAMEAASGAGAGARPMPTRRRVLAPALAVAAAAATGGTGLLAWNRWQAQPVFTQAFSTRRGQQSDVLLPDGSRLRLDAATRLQATYYRQRREVALLDGQAVFAVQGDAARPFHVLAGPVCVTVVGTRFSVRYTPQMPGGTGVQVAVEEGTVRVKRIAAHTDGGAGVEPAVILTAGQQLASDAAGALSAVLPVPAGGIAPWREHRVRFDNQRLDHALAELARYGDPQLLVRDPAVAALPITGVFDPRDMATFRRLLSASLPVRLQAARGGAAEVVLAR
jgi:transmembrane sensor